MRKGLFFVGLSLLAATVMAYDLHTRALTPVVEKAPPPGPSLELVRDGELRFAVVVDLQLEKDIRAKDRKCLEPALEVLLEAFERTTGHRPEVLDPAAAKACGGKLLIALGDSAVAREEAGIDVRQLPEQGFAVKTFPRGLALVGFDSSVVRDRRGKRIGRGHGASTGTYYAALDFAERFLGCRWYFPGENGSVYPKLRNLTITPVWYEDQPEFTMRGSQYYVWGSLSTDALVAKWTKYVGAGLKKGDPSFCRRWRAGGTDPILGSHSPEPISFGKAHPDQMKDIFYTSPNGKFWHNPREHIGNLYDVTNLRFADLLVDAYKRFYESDGKVSIGHVGHAANEDGVSFGVCDTYLPATDIVDNPTVRELNLIRDEEKAGDQAALMRNVYGRFFQYLGNELKRELPGKRLWLLVYYNALFAPNDPRWKLPDNIGINLCIGSIPARVRDAKQVARMRRIAREWYEARNGRPAEFLWLYTSRNNRFKRAIIPEFTAEVPKVLGETLGRGGLFYDYTGSSDLWHYFWAAYVCDRAQWNSALDVEAAIDEMWTLLYGPAAGAHMRAFHRTLKQAYLDYALPAAEDVPQYPLAVIEKLEGELAAAKACLKEGSVEMKRWALVADYWPDAFRTQRARAAYARPVYAAPSFAGESPDWSKVASVPLLEPMGSDSTPQPLELKLAWNARGIYGRFTSRVPPKAEAKRDLWNNDCIELFVSPGTVGETIHQFAWDPTGKDYSRRQRLLPIVQPSETAWSAPGTTCRRETREDGWTATFFVPFGPLEAGVPKAGDEWKLNFVFTGRKGARELIRGNSLTLGNHSNISMYGHIRFAE